MGITENVFVIVMAGGKGERFWPISTRKRPKQFLSLFSGKPMLQSSVDRVLPLVPPERILVITNAELVPLARKVLPRLPARNIIGEPVGRDTAAACALGTAVARSRNPEALCCILTADHRIAEESRFRKILAAAIQEAARASVLVTLGIQPSYPATGFGYIQAGARRQGKGTLSVRQVIRFTEKPCLEKAKSFLRKGNYFWNSGMFVWKADTFFDALRRLAPPLYRMATLVGKTATTPALQRCLKKEYPRLDRISVDYAVMEKSRNILVVPSEFGWDDVGSWAALGKVVSPDPDANVTLGQCLTLDATGNVVYSPGKHITALFGVQNLIVVQGQGVTMVCHRSQAEQIKRLVTRMSSEKKYQHLL